MLRMTSPFRSRPMIVAAVALALLSATFYLAWRSAPAPYKRFVSKPLPDGTRYTFLYPSWMYPPPEPPADDVYVDGSHRIDKFVRAMLWRIGVRTRAQTLRPARTTGIYVAYRRAPIKADARRVRRREGGDWLHHYVDLEDRRSQNQFSLNYLGSVTDRARFEQAEEVVTQSFRILPPGVPVPKP